MNLLLTGLIQRLLLAACALMFLWGVYFWAVAE
ncbi:membrane protein [Neisseria sp. 83E34]|nr:membrane protein [Neisseria sp. 83E34]